MIKGTIPFDTKTLTPAELLTLYARIAGELKTRGITRTANNPTGDLGEYLFCKAFGWEQENNSSKGIDAVDKDGTRYQIKARRITKHSNDERQLSAIRNIGDKHFDFLAGVLFANDYTVARAAIIPCAVVAERARFQAHTNSHVFFLHDDVWTLPNVQDVTQKLRSIEL
jgi:hypothetical protein